MNLEAPGWYVAVVHLTMGMLVVGMLLTLGRLLRGPSIPDRVVALDLIGIIAVGVVAVQTILSEEVLLLRPAPVLALISFLGTVAVAKFLERSQLQ